MLFQVKEITAGKGANVIMESVGGEVFKECLRRLVIMMILLILAIICISVNPCASLKKLTSNSNLPSFHLFSIVDCSIAWGGVILPVGFMSGEIPQV